MRTGRKWHLGLSRVYPDQGCPAPYQPFTEHAHCRYRRAGTELDHEQAVQGYASEPPLQIRLLALGSLSVPVPVAEHQNVRPRELTSLLPTGQRRVWDRQGFGIDVWQDHTVCGPYTATV
ncbi:unnamed protein product [Prorocentrum cordatum]|uniref:Uncharacterized protein n=1 Tax=Prorocentrum cordatum TaxID=2364126 RepID=A0ABN9W4K4_9DINO|nr:unnamed protein product [Polarella glacialis]